MFNLVLVSHTPPTASGDVDAVAASLLRDIGYLPGGTEVPEGTRRRRGRPRKGAVRPGPGHDPPRPGDEVLSSMPYRLLMDHFLAHPERGFSIEDLEGDLDASRPTIYRHLSKLRQLDLLSSTEEDGTAPRRRHYHLRFGDLVKAWRFVEVNAQCALEDLRALVDATWRAARDEVRADRATVELNLDRSASRVSFRLPLSEGSGARPEGGLDALLTQLLLALDLLPPGSASRGVGEVTGGLAYRLVRDCLLTRPDRNWTARELTAVLGTTKPTLYRHMRKLESLDLLERGLRGESPRSSKAYRLRFGDLSKAWNFTEEHARQSLRAYGETVGHLSGLLEGGGRV